VKKVGSTSVVRILVASFFFQVCFFAAAPLAFAKGALSVEATVDSNEVEEGEHFQLDIKVSSEEEVDGQPPRVPQLEGFTLLNSSASQFVNRRMVAGPQGMEFQTERSVVYSFIMAANKKGRLQIPPFEVVVNGKPYFTKPILMNVKDAGQAAPKRRQAPPGFPQDFDDPLEEADQLFQQLLQRRGLVPPGGSLDPDTPDDEVPVPPAGRTFVPKNPNEAFIVHLDADKSEVFEGEQVTGTWYVLVRGQILNLDRSKFPDLKGFWKEVIEEATSLNFSTEVINGITYKKALLASYALFPIKPGNATIDEYRLKATVQVSNNPMSLFGFGPSYTFTRASENLKIKVKPLPAEGKPSNFSGAVGQFEVSASVENPNVPMNQPFSLKIRFEGSGNAKLIELPNIQVPPGIELYETKTEAKFFKNGKSYKEFDVLLIPRQIGAMEIPAVSVSLFDPDLEKYYQKTTVPIQINVGPGKEAEGSGASTRVEAEGDDNKKSSAEPEGPKLPGPALSLNQSLTAGLGLGLLGTAGAGLTGVWVSVAAHGLMLLILLVRSMMLFRTESRLALLKRKLSGRWKKIYKLLDQGDWRGTAKETTNLIYLVLGEISGHGGASMELSKLLEEAPPSVRRELGKDLQECVDLFQTLSFAPEVAVGALKDPVQLKENVKRVQNLIDRALSLINE